MKELLRELLLLQRISLGLQCEHIVADEGADKYVKESAQFIIDALADGHMWALEWHGYRMDTTPSGVADEVGNILTMWRVLVGSFERLSEGDQKDVTAEASVRFGGDGKVTFPGFDGNEESAHLSVAIFLVEKMNRFQELDPRNLNSHWPVLNEYRRMLSVFDSIEDHFRGLDKDSIIRVLNAGG